jgi:hypothetical protein
MLIRCQTKSYMYLTFTSVNHLVFYYVRVYISDLPFHTRACTDADRFHIATGKRWLHSATVVRASFGDSIGVEASFSVVNSYTPNIYTTEVRPHVLSTTAHHSDVPDVGIAECTEQRCMQSCSTNCDEWLVLFNFKLWSLFYCQLYSWFWSMIWNLVCDQKDFPLWISGRFCCEVVWWLQ